MVKGISEVDMPYWIQSNHPLDGTTGILVVVTVYPDMISFTLPAGKRTLGETCLDTIFREVHEEVDIDLRATVDLADTFASTIYSRIYGV
jgi:ADP-ribose pyrophosphatase YjhB (NUDIX family)